MALKYGTFAYLAYCGWQSIGELAGKSTGADLALAVDAAVQLGREEWLHWPLTILMAGWAVAERVARLRMSKSLTAHIADLEHQLTPPKKRQSMVS